jgi:LuxR family maltose regulon positive regulatory protein
MKYNIISLTPSPLLGHLIFMETAPTSSLLATKLHPPSPPPKRVARPQLLERLNRGLDSGRQITLVSAPAGFGKTVCASEWIHTLDLPVTWLSLDPADDDPGRFFSYLVAALHKVDENLGWEIDGILRAGQLPPGEIISTTLINDILALDTRFVLVLDDFQVIQDEQILQVLEQLVAHLPETLHLVLLTREDPNLPLARLRANNQLTEIRAGDLRFSNPEADRFLTEVMALSLSQSDINVLEARTEGWIAGLHLAALALQSLTKPQSGSATQSRIGSQAPLSAQAPLSQQNRSDPSTFIANLSGSHRFILSYLSEEVLNRQSEDVQDFFLQTSILDRLNGDLCDAVTGRTDSHALLKRLYQANLFLIPLDDEGHWYRTHQLFTDLLRDLQERHHPEATIELHKRASGWYIQADQVSEAIQHALAAQDYAVAVGLIESHAMDMLMQWHLKTVDGWMGSIPVEWIADNPHANIVFAWMHLMRPDYPQASPYLERLKVMFSDPDLGPDDPALMSRWFTLQAMLLNAQGQAAECLQLCSQALDLVPEGDDHVRNMIYLELAKAYEQSNEYDLAMETYRTIIRGGQTAGNSVTELLGASALGLLALKHGKLHYAFEIISEGIERIERSGSLPPISTAVYGELGVIYYQWHQLEQAHYCFQRAIQVSTLSGYSDAELYYGVILSRLYHIQGDLGRAVQEIQKSVDLMKIHAPAAVKDEVIAQQVRIQLAQGCPSAAEATLRSQDTSFKEQFTLPSLVEPQKISAVRILLYRAQVQGELTHLQPGIEQADELIDWLLSESYILFALETLLLRAQLHAVAGDEQASVADYLSALKLGEPEGAITCFVEEGPLVAEDLAKMLEADQLGSVQPAYIEDILAAFSSGKQPGVQPGKGVVTQTLAADPEDQIIDPLTERELDVLRLMAEGLKYEQIGDRLYISLNTVRYHVKAIYGKLNVNNRTKAIEKAHQLGIL